MGLVVLRWIPLGGVSCSKVDTFGGISCSKVDTFGWD